MIPLLQLSKLIPKISFIVFLLFQSQFVQAKNIDKIIAIVNDEIILKSDLVIYKKKLKKDGLVDDALLKITDKKVLLKSQKALVDHLINEKIIDSEVKRNDLQVTIEKVEAELRDIARKNGISRSQLKQAIKNQGVNFSEYQDFIKTSLERKSLIDKEITSKIKISDEEIFEYYSKNSGKNDQQVFEYSLSHIVFNSAGKGEGAAIDRAAAVYEKLSSGESFEELASRYSEDPDFNQGGFLGSFKLSDMSPNLRAGVKNLSVGQYSKVIALGKNFHIVKLSKKVLIPNPAVLKQKPRITAILMQEAFKAQFKSWLSQKRQEAFIKKNI